MKSIIAAAAAVAMLATAAQAAETPQEKANKALVLRMWGDMFDHQDVSKAKVYMAEGYIQHNPLAAQGRKGFEEYFGKVWPHRLADAEVKPTRFDVVMAEGDLVTLIQRIPRKDASGQTYDSFWFDTLRVKDGMMVEHWDNALKPSK